MIYVKTKNEFVAHIVSAVRFRQGFGLKHIYKKRGEDFILC